MSKIGFRGLRELKVFLVSEPSIPLTFKFQAPLVYILINRFFYDTKN